MVEFKRNALAASVMTGVTALLGGIEPALAAISTQNDTFSFSVFDSSSGTPDASGTFSDPTDNTAPTQFSLFNDLGGTLTLTQVVVNVLTTGANLSVDVSGSCDVSGSVTCGANATNSSEFSALIDLGSGIDLGLQPFATSQAIHQCTAFSPVEPCFYSDFQSSSPNVLAFSATIMGGDPNLALFVGSGNFDITPALALGGLWEAFLTSENSGANGNYGVSASTDWSGTISVEYTYEIVPNGVPEPATIFLLGAGLAGLGLLRRKPKGSA